MDVGTRGQRKRKVILYIAMSLDGYIADRQGGVDWLDQASHGEEDSGYEDFIQTVDTVLMGYRTYHQVTTQLSPDQWPYEGLTAYVLTHRHLSDPKDIHFVNGPLDQLLDRLRGEEGKDIWLCGGAELVRQTAETDQIDQIRLTILPVLLGGGVRLFGEGEESRFPHLTGCRRRGGMVECIYDRR